MAGESKDFTVDLMDNAAKQFHAVGATTPLVPFRIVLSPCGSSVTAVKVGFVGVADSINTDLLQLDGGASAAAGWACRSLTRSRRRCRSMPHRQRSLDHADPGQTNTLNFTPG